MGPEVCKLARGQGAFGQYVHRKSSRGYNTRRSSVFRHTENLKLYLITSQSNVLFAMNSSSIDHQVCLTLSHPAVLAFPTLLLSRALQRYLRFPYESYGIEIPIPYIIANGASRQKSYLRRSLFSSTLLNVSWLWEAASMLVWFFPSSIELHSRRRRRRRRNFTGTQRCLGFVLCPKCT